jgi:hypothetical protein
MPLVHAIVLLLAGLVLWASALPSAQSSAPPAAQKKNPLLKLVEPWPSPDKMKERRETAETLPLFADTGSSDHARRRLQTINKDAIPTKQQCPGRAAHGGQHRAAGAVQARGRAPHAADATTFRSGRVREEAKGTVRRQDALKLVVQCAGGAEYEQYVLREYLAYRIHNVLTRQSFRARLAKVSYVDRASGKPMGTRLGIFLEDGGDVARRLEGRVVELQRLLFENLDNDSLMPAMIFEYMIGNTDMSIFALHNVRIVQRQDKSLHVIPYDFDFSGLVNAPYALPARGFLLKNVTERLYRGPCRSQELVDPYVANFVAKKDVIRALPDQIPGFSRPSRDESRNYIDGFYSSINSPKDVRRLFVSCSPKSTM